MKLELGKERRQTRYELGEEKNTFLKHNTTINVHIRQKIKRGMLLLHQKTTPLFFFFFSIEKVLPKSLTLLVLMLN